MKKKKQKRINLLSRKISNRLSYTIIAFVALMLVGVFVFAAVPNPGHSYDELDLGPITIESNEVVINEGAGNNDFRIESIMEPHMFFVDADKNNIGIGTLNPQKTLDVIGQVKASGFCIGGDCISSWPGGSSQTLAQVLAQGNSAGSYNIDMSNHNILDVNNLQVNTLEDPEDGQLIVNDQLKALGGVSGEDDYVGVYGEGDYVGVWGKDPTTNSYGQIGVGDYGVWGRGNGGGSYQGVGVYGEGTGVKPIGVWGQGKATSGEHYGGYFKADGTGSGIGAWGHGDWYDFYAGGPGTNYGASSSIRWKNNITEIDNALDKILNIRGVYFDWDEEHGGQHDMGFIAEEVGEYIPEIVSYEDATDKSNWYIDSEGNKKLYTSGIDYGALTPVLVEAIKELKGENDLLKSELCKRDNSYSWC